jgi:Concanavalin A-like lectin/glucanases superfamily
MDSSLIKELSQGQGQGQGQGYIAPAILTCIIVFIAIILSKASKDPDTLNAKAFSYTFIIIAAFIFFTGIFISRIADNPNSAMTVVIVGMVIMFICCLAYFYNNIDSTGYRIISLFIQFLILVIFVVGLAIIFYCFSNYLKSFEGPEALAINVFFYIPCLLLEFIQYLIKEFRMTTNTVYILFILEIVLILVYMYVPKLLEKIVIKNGIVLLPDAAFLDSQTVIGNSIDLLMPLNKSLNDPNEKLGYRTEYSISMWLYLNNQPLNYQAYAKETNIFSYTNRHPAITYYNNTSAPENTDDIDNLLFYFSNSTNGSAPFPFKIPKQKWNQIVFNYTSTQADLFINGILVKTHIFNESMPTYSAEDLVVIGDDNGLDGALCNINYGFGTMTKYQIANSYNLLMNRNPPTNNL